MANDRASKQQQRRLDALERKTLALGTEALYRDPALYEQLYVRRRQDVRFYVERALRSGGPVLEIGAGSGRITAPLVEAGLDVVGIDPMRSMLAHARARLSELPYALRRRAQLRTGDVRRLMLGRSFQTVIAPFNVLQHLYTVSDLECAFASCAAHLAPRGTLIFDVLMPDLAALRQSPDRSYRVGTLTHPLTKTRYVLRESSHYDPVSQIRTTHMFLEPRGGGDHAAAGVVPIAQRQIFPGELDLLVRSAGLQIVERFGDFDGAPCSATAPSQIIVARLRKAG